MLLEQLASNIVGLVSVSTLDQVDHSGLVLIGAEDLLDFEASVEAIWQLLFSVNDELVGLQLLR